MFQIDYYAYSNRMVSIHPAEKFSFSFITMLICLVINSYAISLAVILLMTGAVVLRAGIPCRLFLKLMAMPAAFLLVGVAAIALSVSLSGQAEGTLWGFSLAGVSVGVAAENLALAGSIFLKSLAAASCLYFLALTTPMVDIISLLRKIKAPSLFVELMGLVYRFIFVLAETAEKIYTSQSSRLGYVNMNRGYHSLGQLVSNLFIKSYHRSKMLFNALVSRCYTGEIAVLERSYSISPGNIAIILILDISLVLFGIWERWGGPLA